MDQEWSCKAENKCIKVSDKTEMSLRNRSRRENCKRAAAVEQTVKGSIKNLERLTVSIKRKARAKDLKAKPCKALNHLHTLFLEDLRLAGRTFSCPRFLGLDSGREAGTGEGEEPISELEAGSLT